MIIMTSPLINNLVVLVSLIGLAQCQAPPGTSSLAFVFDTTGSMYDDLVQVREGAKKIYTTVLEQREKLIYNYVLMPFHDPEVGPVLVTSDPHKFQRKLDQLYVQGGGDCPEMSISGIKKALETALPASFIYIFTDSRSKDYHLTDAVLNLVQEKQSQVVFVMTGDCGNRTHPGYTAFEKIASASSGQIFHLEKTDVKEVLNYVRVTVQTRKVNIEAVDRPFGGSNVLNIPVDTYLNELHVSVSGGDPKVQLIDPDGNTKSKAVSSVLGIENAYAVSADAPKRGIWQLRVTADTKHSLRVTGIGAIHFNHGFSSRPVSDFGKVHHRPLKVFSGDVDMGIETYLMVNMSGLDQPGIVNTIALVNLTGEVLYVGPATQNTGVPHLYHVGPFVPPNTYFFIKVVGRDDQNYDFQRYSLTAMSPETEGAPRLYMQPLTTAFRMSSVNLTCDVDSRAPYSLYWYKGNNLINGPLFFKASETVTHTIKDVSFKDDGEYSCKISSQTGNNSASTVLQTREPAPHIIAPKNVTVPAGVTAYLHCRTQVEGQAAITWSQHGRIPIESSDRAYKFANGTLLMRDVSKLDEGGYRCRVTTPGGVAEAIVYLNILQPPTAVVDPKQLYFTESGVINISCSATGDPRPKVDWYANGRKIQPGGRNYVSYKYDLYVRGAAASDAGQYECKATSEAGVASDTATAMLAVPPQVSVQADRNMIGRGDTVVLNCQVIAGTPQPTITWFKNGRELTAFKYISISRGRLTIQGAQDVDAGAYRCRGSNVAGIDDGEVTLDVGSIPSIVPGPDTVTVNIESDATMQCRATGHPKPVITWQKDGQAVRYNDRVQLLPDGSLYIRKSQMDDQTRYTCTATNKFGRQDAQRSLMITGLISPVLGHQQPEQQLIEGQVLRLSCIVVVGTPKPVLTWTKNNVEIRTGGNIFIEGAGSSLLIRNGDPSDEGRYTCTATNAAGNASINIQVQIITKPVIDKKVNEYTVDEGKQLELPCVVKGRPKPTLSWQREGRPMLLNTNQYMMQSDGRIVIYRANKKDSGLYMCTASNPAGEDMHAIRVTVRVPPTILRDQEAFNVVAGNSITISCRAIGDPQPKVEWFFGDKLLKNAKIGEDGALTIKKPKPEHRGKYKCVATNSVGSATRSIELAVHTKPEISTGEELKTIYVTVNDSAKLECPARAEPPPTRTWTYEGRRVFRGYSYGSELRFTGEGTLEIDRAQMQHTGMYRCVVSNLAGNDSVTYQLIVQDPPKIISDIAGTLDVVLGLMMEVPCRAIGTPKPTISWKRDGFEVLADSQMKIDPDGTLRIAETELTHAGVYTCVAKNTAGNDSRSTTVVVQEPPTIRPSTESDYSIVEASQVVMVCDASGQPDPQIHWYRRGSMIQPGTPGIEVDKTSGQITIKNVQSADHGAYLCKAVNPAGSDEKVIKLTVIVPPDIPEQDKIIEEDVLIGKPFSLYCPVFSTPIPQITWEVDSRPLAENDPNIELSEDRRRLHVQSARVTDAGVYRCVARNPAGESTKTFEVDVLIPPNLDESKYSRKVEVVQNNSISIGCPVSGLPEPDINWLANGQLLESGPAQRGIQLSKDKKLITISSAALDHEGSYTCLASNKAGSLDIDIELSVLAPPSLGDDENVTTTVGNMVTFNCELPQSEKKSSITWLYNEQNVERLGDSVQLALQGRRMYLKKAKLSDKGRFSCVVRNTAGENRKNYNLIVLAPPEFREKTYERNLEVSEGEQLQMACQVKGHPDPKVRWLRNGQAVSESSITGVQLQQNNQILVIEKTTSGLPLQYTCIAENTAGSISRDFFVQTIAAPIVTGDGDETLVIRRNQGSSVTLECPFTVTFGLATVEWTRDGRPLPDQPNVQVSLDQYRVHMMNIQPDDQAIYTCVASNAAGQASKNFRLIVQVPPKLDDGKLVEDIEVIEGQSLTLRCAMQSTPPPTMSWSKDGFPITGQHDIQIMADNSTMYVAESRRDHAGTYFCKARNPAGAAEKTFNVRVILKPEMLGDNEVTTIEVIVTTPVTFDCPIKNPINVEFSWLRHQQPLANGQHGAKIITDGRHLHLADTKRADAGEFTCEAKNEAGRATKKYNLVVLVPPTIIGAGGSRTVIENGTLMLPCETDGFPNPVITWTKDGEPVSSLPNVEIISRGQQFRITAAAETHEGDYMCVATNPAGQADIEFDVDVITRPNVAQSIKNTIEVIVGDNANIRCPIVDQRDPGEIIWMRDRRPITDDNEGYQISQSRRKFHLSDAVLTDEGVYSCRVTNKAGKADVDFKLIVLEPPKILILAGDKNRTSVENSTVVMSCPAEGKPDPEITWLKDGAILDDVSITSEVNGAVLQGNEIRIARVKVSNGGRFTCLAKNKAGEDEQDILLFVMTPPRIEREGQSDSLAVALDSRTSISCPAFGRPSPSVTWLKDGRPLDTSGSVLVSASGQRLHLINLKKSDAGRYTCMAKNAAGDDKRDFTLAIQEKPSISGENLPRTIPIEVGRTQFISCPAKGSPEPTISWLKNGQPVETGEHVSILSEGRQLQLTAVTLQETGTYTCIASNPVGVVDLDTFVEVIGTPQLMGPDFETVEVIQSQAADLTCNITANGQVQITWQKNGESLDILMPTQQKYIQLASQDRRVHVLSARVEDAGRYTCVGQNNAGTVTKSFELKVLVPPTINDTISSKPLQTIVPNAQLRLDCQASGTPEPMISWEKDGSPLVEASAEPEADIRLMYGNMTLLIRKATDNDAARYTCSATNKVGATSKDFVVQLRANDTDAAPPTIEQGEEQRVVNVGDYIILTCHTSTGGSNLDVQWMIDGTKVANGPYSPSVTVENWRIDVRDARLSDEGKYSCIVSNDAGSAQKHFQLTVREPPRFIDITNLSPSIIVNKPLTLDCSVTGTPKPVVTWSKDGVEIEENPLHGRFINERHQYEIASAQEMDEGRYSCVAVNDAGHAEKDMLVAVLLAPTMGEAQRAFEVVENETLTLVCPANAAAEKIQWMKNGIPITTSNLLQLSASGRKLHLMRARTSDDARYTCAAENAAGKVDMDIMVTVLVPPKIINRPSYITRESVLNTTVQLECQATGVPDPVVAWRKDGRPFLEGDRIQLLNNGSVLRINEAQLNDEARYTCEASNKIGRAEADTFLTLKTPPKIAEGESTLKTVLGDGRTIRCEVEGRPQPEVTWLRNGQPYTSALIQSSFDVHYMHIVDAQLSDAGRYTCVAKNDVGRDQRIVELMVLVPPSIESGERVMWVTEGRPISLDCLATGQPQPDITWLRDGGLLNNQSGHYEVVADGKRLTILEASSSDEGRYTCKAVNEADEATADFMIEVATVPRFVNIEPDVRENEGNQLKLACTVKAKPAATIEWFKGGRPIGDMPNVILSPRGEHLMLLDAKPSDAGSYSCLAKNKAGQNETQFTVTVLVAPHIDETLDQNPKVVVGQSITIKCPVLGIPDPLVEWRKDGVGRVDVDGSDRVQLESEKHLRITVADQDDTGRYTCHATNDAGLLDTDFALKVIGPPKFGDGSTVEYEVIAGSSVTMDCEVQAEPAPEITWMKGDAPVYLDSNVWISADNRHLTLSESKMSDGGRYTCKATNVAGTTNIDMSLRVLVAPVIDKSNIIGNPLAIVNKSITLECPASGVPTPVVTWHKNGKSLTNDDERITLSNGNQTINIQPVLSSDEGRFACVAENKAGTADHDFALEVMTPPMIEQAVRMEIVKREGEPLTLTCPIVMDQLAPDVLISWHKDSRSLDPLSIPDLRISNGGRRLHHNGVKLTDAGLYSCIASNRAGESSAEFALTVQSPPLIDTSRNDPQPRVLIDKSISLYCMVTGHPVPTVNWQKDGQPLLDGPEYRFVEDNQGIMLVKAESKHKGRYTCIAENDAGRKDADVVLDVLVPPTVSISGGGEEAIRTLGQPIVLLCQASGVPKPSLKWLMNGQTLVSTAAGARISSDGGRLDIPRLRVSDVGDYKCIAHNEAGQAEAQVHVDVLVAPSIKRENIDMNPVLPADQTLTLQCEAEGKPTPTITWLVREKAGGQESIIAESTDRLELGPQGRFIQITNVELSDAKVYRCEAKNSAGEDEIIYNVDIVQAPSIGSGGTVQVVEGQKATMVCEAFGEPLPNIEWERNGRRMKTYDRIAIDGKELRITNAKSFDAGIYVCLAANEAGRAQQAYTLEVLVPPKITDVSPEQTSVPSSKGFSLKCGARGYPDPKISWMMKRTREGQEEEITTETVGHSVDESGTLTVTEAPSGSPAVQYWCKATNDAGEDQRNYVVSLINPPRVLSSGIREMNVSQGSPTIMTCVVEGDGPLPEIVWYHNNQKLETYEHPTMSLDEDHTELTIGDTRLTNEGLYDCVAVNPAGNATMKFRLNVGVSPEIDEEPARIIAKEGNRAEIICHAIGVPKPTITWLLEDKELPADMYRGEVLVINPATSDDTKVYTCKATNWVASAYKNVELVVLVPPQITPERLNMTVKLGDTILLPCNATAYPEPTVTWYGAGDSTPIVPSEKHKFLGNSLAIQDAEESDDKYYQCVAKSAEDKAVGHRRLFVEVPEVKMKTRWVECDDQGRPIRTLYIPRRGDVPDDTQELLPWKTELRDLPANGTNNTIIKCLPPNKAEVPEMSQSVIQDRPIQLSTARKPMIVEQPQSNEFWDGQVLIMSCTAKGTPTPTIEWIHRGQPIRPSPPTVNGRSVLKIDEVNQNDNDGPYICLAKNEHGIDRSQANVRILPKPQLIERPPELTVAKRTVAVLSCYPATQLGRLPTWFDGRAQVQPTDHVNILANGSLVIFEPFSDTDLTKFTCRFTANGQRPAQHHVQYVKQTVNERLPEVRVSPRRQQLKPNSTVFIHCGVHAEPLTTRVSWLKNGHMMVVDDRVHLHYNNSLQILNASETDRAVYRCVAQNNAGTAYDDAAVLVVDGPIQMRGSLEGNVNHVRLASQPLFANITPFADANRIDVRFDGDQSKLTPVSRASIGFASSPCWAMASGNGAPNGYQLSNGQFTRKSEYRFNTGEKLVVKQRGRGLNDAGYLVMDVLLDGDVPSMENEQVVGMAPVTEQYVQEHPGKIRGSGRSTLNVGPHYAVPFEWNHDIEYDASESNHKMVPTHTVNINAVDLTTDNSFNRANYGFALRASTNSNSECPPGYLNNNQENESCLDVDECKKSPCKSDQKCINTMGSYRCEGDCQTGYYMAYNGTCLDVDECALAMADCGNRMQCVNQPGTFACMEPCPKGYTRTPSGECKDIDECLTEIPCHPTQMCRNTRGGFRCTCSRGLIHLSNNRKCKAVSMPSAPIPEVQKAPPVKPSNCPPGLYMGPNHQCIDRDECSETVQPCEFECVNTHGGYHCQCPVGYELASNGVSCHDIDECKISPGICSASFCLNVYGSYECIDDPCPKGYKVDRSQKQCDLTDDSITNAAEFRTSTIQIQAIALPQATLSKRDLLRLTAYDSQGHVLRKTNFRIVRSMTEAVALDDLPFSLRLDGGRGTVFTRSPLQAAADYRFLVRAVSFPDDHMIQKVSKYQTDFLVLVTVGEHKF